MNGPLLQKLQKTKNSCSRLYKKEKNTFSNNKLNTSFVSNNKLFWRIVNLFFFLSIKGSHQSNIQLVTANKLLQDDGEVTEELNKTNFLKEAVSTLDINEYSNKINPDSINVLESVEKAMGKYIFHSSYLFIIDKIVYQDKFSFKPISKLDIEKEVQSISPKKATTSDSISPERLKLSSKTSADVLHNLFNDI